MEPEIARRCQDCGASVRSGSFFCPQCGRPLKAGATNADRAAAPGTTPARRKTDTGEAVAPTRDASGSEPDAAAGIMSAQAISPTAPPPPPPPAPRGTADEGQGHAEVAGARADSGGGGRSTRQRVTAAARDVVEEKLSPRVEKLRHASNIMLEEAAYDPSLRFVLVAVAFILLSLLLLLLNYLLG
jgi:hypothetical protein